MSYLGIGLTVVCGLMVYGIVVSVISIAITQTKWYPRLCNKITSRFLARAMNDDSTEIKGL